MLLSILPAVGDIGLYARKIWDIAQIAFPGPMFAKSTGITKTKKQTKNRKYSVENKEYIGIYRV